ILLLRRHDQPESRRVQTLGLDEPRCLEPGSETSPGERTDAVESLPDSRSRLRNGAVATAKHRQSQTAIALEDTPHLDQRTPDTRKEMHRSTAIHRVKEFATKGQLGRVAANQYEVIKGRPARPIGGIAKHRP